MSEQKAQEGSRPTPSPQVRELNKLLGTWRVTGGVEGTVTYRWMEGEFFLLQEVDLKHGETVIRGLEIIGHLRPFGEPAGTAIMSRFYDSEGNTLDYEYELQGNELTIWGGFQGSPSYFRGTFDDNGRVNRGAWVYPGGGYDSTMVRIDTEETGPGPGSRER